MLCKSEQSEYYLPRAVSMGILPCRMISSGLFPPTYVIFFSFLFFLGFPPTPTDSWDKMSVCSPGWPSACSSSCLSWPSTESAGACVSYQFQLQPSSKIKSQLEPHVPPELLRVLTIIRLSEDQDCSGSENKTQRTKHLKLKANICS